MSGQMLGMKNKIAVANTQNRVAEAMGAAGNAMQMANAQLDNKKFNDAMKNMMKQDQYLQMKQDMMEDGLDMFTDNMYDKEEAMIYINKYLKKLELIQLICSQVQERKNINLNSQINY